MQVKTSRVYIHDVTFITPLSLMLFGANVRVSRMEGSRKRCSINVDGWISFKMQEVR
jgi:hypothetical protein